MQRWKRTYLGKVSNNVIASFTHFRHDVEKERIRVVVERLVIQKELCEKT